MIQAIFFDVDGTLVSFRTHTIPASTLEALHTLRAKGIKLFLATGRHQAMLRSVQELFPFDGCVTLSGQYCFVGDRVPRQFIQDLYIPMPPVRPARYALGREIYQAVTFLSREQEHLLLDRAPHLKTTRWHPNFLDVIPPTGGKDLGMDAILDHFGIPLENCMAFGDGENDLSMLIHAGIGVAMGTASGAVKAQADYTAPSVDEDGIARTLSHLGLLP